MLYHSDDEDSHHSFASHEDEREGHKVDDIDAVCHLISSDVMLHSSIYTIRNDMK
jgi:hypothetical protein